MRRVSDGSLNILGDFFFLPYWNGSVVLQITRCFVYFYIRIEKLIEQECRTLFLVCSGLISNVVRPYTFSRFHSSNSERVSSFCFQNALLLTLSVEHHAQQLIRRCRCRLISPSFSRTAVIDFPFEYPFRYSRVIHSLKRGKLLQFYQFKRFGSYIPFSSLMHLIH